MLPTVTIKQISEFSEEAILTERIISVGKTLFKRVVSGPNSSPIRVNADDASEATAIL